MHKALYMYIYIYQWLDLGIRLFTHLLKSVFSRQRCPLNMYLGGGNNFNVFSPTHDSKLVTRLQHVFHAVRAAGRPADNNRMWHISGDCQRFGNEWYLFVCLLTASRTGTCRPISMGSWPWRRSKMWIRALQCPEIEGQNANQMANHLLIVTNMQLSLMKSFMMPFKSESTTKMNTQEGRGQEKEMWPE